MEKPKIQAGLAVEGIDMEAEEKAIKEAEEKQEKGDE